MPVLQQHRARLWHVYEESTQSQKRTGRSKYGESFTSHGNGPHNLAPSIPANSHTAKPVCAAAVRTGLNGPCAGIEDPTDSGAGSWNLESLVSPLVTSASPLAVPIGARDGCRTEQSDATGA